MRIEKNKSGSRIHADFDSVSDFAAYVTENARPAGKYRNRDADSFTGYFDFNSALDTLRDGWTEGRADTAADFAEIESKTANIIESSTLSRDVIGDFYDLGDVALGIPEAAFITDSDQSNVYRILLNYSKSAGVSIRQIKNLGVAISALIAALQAGGDSVELTLASVTTDLPTSDSKKSLLITIPIDCSALDGDQLLFCTACPAMLRVLTFAAKEAITETDDCSTYGYPASIKHSAFDKFINLDSYDIIVDSRVAGNGMTEFDSVESSINWINNKIEQLQGVTE